MYGDRGGCPVFRVTWLNGIALAHSCPLRRDGRLASRFFPHFAARPSLLRHEARSLVSRKRLSLFSDERRGALTNTFVRIPARLRGPRGNPGGGAFVPATLLSRTRTVRAPTRGISPRYRARVSSFFWQCKTRRRFLFFCKSQTVEILRIFRDDPEPLDSE